MAITRLKRKALRNKVKAKVRAQKMKLQGHVPVIKQIDIEAIEAGFKAKPAKVEKPAKEVEAKAETAEVAVEKKPVKKVKEGK